MLIHHLIWIGTGSVDCSDHLGWIQTGSVATVVRMREERDGEDSNAGESGFTDKIKQRQTKTTRRGKTGRQRTVVQLT